MIKPADVIMCVKTTQILRHTTLEIINWMSTTSQLWQFLFNEECTHTESLKTSALSDKDRRPTDKLRTKYFLNS